MTTSEEVDDQRLCRSLQQGPEDIKREYDRSVRRLGERFRKGDGKFWCISLHFALSHICLYAYSSLKS